MVVGKTWWDPRQLTTSLSPSYLSTTPPQPVFPSRFPLFSLIPFSDFPLIQRAPVTRACRARGCGATAGGAACGICRSSSGGAAGGSSSSLRRGRGVTASTARGSGGGPC
ncbi:hypothetical protein SEVIR_4G127701v4 [Setaria viridis]|uniref:Uncharacterized protein n=1 Tax=Setaria viridis TaxID=4556 RepID=A0A4U6V413_SETVI|nr:hypothetical protein SEVIR_4G127701v2 [Setaria viridis]